MRRSLTFLRRSLNSLTRPRTIVRRQPTTRLYLECLEDRIVPTVRYLQQPGDRLRHNSSRSNVFPIRDRWLPRGHDG
jgi:hypothetical protein